MKKYSLLIIFILVLLPSTVLAAWNRDYLGSKGDKEIGMTLTVTSGSGGRTCKYRQIVDSHYFYRKDLVDISLKLKEQHGRSIVLEERNSEGALVGTFNLESVAKDPQNHYRDSAELCEEVLVGSWLSSDGKKSLPIYLISGQGVGAGPNGDIGGRCGLSQARYLQVQNRIKEFHKAAVSNDTRLLKEEFNITRPLSELERKLISESIPHDMFCNYQGIMLGSGIVWFDYEGNPINK